MPLGLLWSGCLATPPAAARVTAMAFHPGEVGRWFHESEKSFFM
jgi:hypothetical protein